MVVCLTVSCTHNKTSLSIGPGVVSLSSPQDVIVEMTGETYDKLETILQQVSYVKLSAIPLLSRIKKIQIADERIYLWDLVVGIVCYDMSGELLFQLNARGQGPGEYTDINAFAVNASLHQLVIYDNMKQSLMFYSTEDGRFVKSEKFNKPTPAEIAYWGGYFFYHNRLHRNYQDDISLHY